MKKLCVIALSLGLVLALTSCNKNLIDMTYSYDYAYIELPNGQVVEGEVTSWCDYEDGDQLQVTINHTTYLVHSSHCVLVKHGDQI